MDFLVVYELREGIVRIGLSKARGRSREDKVVIAFHDKIATRKPLSSEGETYGGLEAYSNYGKALYWKELLVYLNENMFLKEMTTMRGEKRFFVQYGGDLPSSARNLAAAWHLGEKTLQWLWGQSPPDVRAGCVVCLNKPSGIQKY